MFKVMQAHDIRYFFYVGGNDSSDTVRIVNEQAQQANYELRAIHIPKTIDNDLMENDHCPGFGSAARFVAQAFTGVNLDNRALKGVYIGVVMGRHAGFLTASSALGRKYYDDGPHLVYVPERAFDTEKFLADVDRVYSKFGMCTIAVSEGISDKDGNPMITKLMGEERDAHGNLQLSGTGALGDLLSQTIKDGLKLKRVRSDTYGYLQRCFIGCRSDRDAHEAREVGEKAVQYAMWDNVDGSIAIRRPVLNYSVDYELVPIEKVAGKTRHMPDNFINADANGVTEDFLNYCRPLLGSDFPQSHRLRAPMVPKILHK
jgi:6-phosphofructokinase 1